ncbi:hypothetical protein CA606_09355 [Caulobacter vibrioides]|uniref:Uncharacterized protein n=1 Tax=Caulobacter vibrioides TaxID=155892 RepID=A0A290MKE1_CAUVI|nr:hypothetical protein CA606_09355 [Caulobacter vibrioides]
MTLAEAVAVFGEALPITEKLLRTEIANGRLAAALVARKFFVTPRHLRAMFAVSSIPKPKAVLGKANEGVPDRPPVDPAVAYRVARARVAALCPDRRRGIDPRGKLH